MIDLQLLQMLARGLRLGDPLEGGCCSEVERSLLQGEGPLTVYEDVGLRRELSDRGGSVRGEPGESPRGIPRERGSSNLQRQ